MKDCINMFNKMMYGSSAIIPGLTMNTSGILLIIIGGIIAGIGLLYNNYMIIISSMLLSPIGDFIIRFALGYRYWKPNTTMMTDGIIGITAQFSMSILIGYIMGITNKEFGEPFKMPTVEMNDRVKPRNYIKDYILALLMGFILGNSLIYSNTTALVGLRLCLAVLPALVNGGLYIAMAHYEKDNNKYNEYMHNGMNMMRLVSIYIIGVLFTTIIGFYMFC